MSTHLSLYVDMDGAMKSSVDTMQSAKEKILQTIISNWISNKVVPLGLLTRNRELKDMDLMASALDRITCETPLDT